MLISAWKVGDGVGPEDGLGVGSGVGGVVGVPVGGLLGYILPVGAGVGDSVSQIGLQGISRV